MYSGAYECAHVWRPEVNDNYFLIAFHLIFEKGLVSWLNVKLIQLNWPAGELWTSFRHPRSTVVIKRVPSHGSYLGAGRELLCVWMVGALLALLSPSAPVSHFKEVLAVCIAKCLKVFGVPVE